MKNFYYFLVIIIIFVLPLNTFAAGDFVWVKSTDANNGWYSNMDTSNNIYYTGSFTGTVDFNPGAGTTNLAATGSADVFVSKLDSDGSFVWAKSFSGSASAFSQALDIDSSGNVYIGIYFTGTVDFDPGVGTTNLTSNGGNDVAIVKLDSAGDFLWVKRVGTTSHDYIYSLVLDVSDNIYVTGIFSNTVDFDPGAGTTNLTSNGGSDIFISKLDLNGNLLEAKNIGEASSESLVYLNIDSNNELYLIGNFSNTVDFDPGAGTTNLTSNGAKDVFLLKLDSSLALSWAKTFGGTGNDAPSAVVADGDSNIYVNGTFTNTVDFDPGAGTTNLTSNGGDDIFITKFDLSGELSWVKQIGNANSEFPYSIALDSTYNVYSTGYFYDTVDFDPGAGTTNLTSNGGSDDLFLVKLDTDGAFQFAKAISNSGSEGGLSINIDSSDDIYLLGYFDTNNTDFDPGAGTNNISPISGFDTFILKLSNAGDSTAPSLTEVTPINVSADRTPDYTFNTNEAGTITYGGDCTSSTTNATVGNNTITFEYLAAGSHTNCTIIVTDASANASTSLAISSFEIVVHGGGGNLIYQIINIPVVPELTQPSAQIIPENKVEIKIEEISVTKSCNKLPENPNILKYRDVNDTVKLLQKILNCKGYELDKVGPGSKDNETNKFAVKTKQAVIKFQKDKNIKIDGIVGPITRIELNK